MRQIFALLFLTSAVAALIVDSALSRKESRGLHYTLDYLEKNDREYVRNTLINRL